MSNVQDETGIFPNASRPLTNGLYSTPDATFQNPLNVTAVNHLTQSSESAAMARQSSRQPSSAVEARPQPPPRRNEIAKPASSRVVTDDVDATVRPGMSRSDRIACFSVGLLLLLLLVRFRYPDFAREFLIEIRFLVALFATCFTLGISGWFAEDRKHPTKLSSTLTIAMVFLLVGVWESVLSGSASTMAMQLLQMLIARHAA